MSLHKTVENTLQLARFTAFGIGGFIVLLILVRIIIGLKEMIFPTTPPPPTVLFGKLQAITFPQSILERKLVYPIDTVSGTLPRFPDRIEVYPIIQPQPSLLYLNRATQKVSQLGFSNKGKQIAPTVYEWDNPNPPYKKIVLDIISFNFELTSNFITDTNVLNSNGLRDRSQAIDISKGFLSNISSFPSDIDDALTQATLLSIKNGNLVPATSLSTTKLIQVNFFQKKINNHQIYYPNYPSSSMNTLVGGGGYQAEVVGAHFFHQQIGLDFATYPIKTVTEAYAQLQNGQGYIVSFNGNGKAAYITNVYLGYYLGETKQVYLMPIYIFEGRNGFYAFVSAVKDEWIK